MQLNLTIKLTRITMPRHWAPGYLILIPWHGATPSGPVIHGFHSLAWYRIVGSLRPFFPFWLAGTLVGILGIITIHPPYTCYLGTNGIEEWVRSHCAPLNSYVTNSVVAHLVRPHAFLLSKRINAYLLKRGIPSEVDIVVALPVCDFPVLYDPSCSFVCPLVNRLTWFYTHFSQQFISRTVLNNHHLISKSSIV